MTISSLYLSGKKRKFEAVVQGRFKQAISYADVYVGQIFTGSLTHAPPDWLISLLLPIMQTLSPGLKMDLTHPEHPYLLSPLMSTMQSVSISLPGHEPDILSVFGSTRDDLTLLDEDLFCDMDISARKSYFSSTEHLRRFEFSPSHVYTFGFYQHVVNMVNMHIEPVPFVSYGLDHVIGRRPIQFMAAVLPSEQLEAESATAPPSPDKSRSPSPVTARRSDVKDSTGVPTRLSESNRRRPRVHKQLEWRYIYDVEVCKTESAH